LRFWARAASRRRGSNLVPFESDRLLCRSVRRSEIHRTFDSTGWRERNRGSLCACVRRPPPISLWLRWFVLVGAIPVPILFYRQVRSGRTCEQYRIHHHRLSLPAPPHAASVRPTTRLI